jgi:hypothetical protein
MEMWCATILQTLPRPLLLRYIPGISLSPRAGLHLNLASPLIQTHQPIQEGSWLEGDVYKSQDPLIRDYYQQCRIGYEQLKLSSDPVLYEYWRNNKSKAVAAQTASHRARIREKALSGMEVKFDRGHFWIGTCKIQIPVEIVRPASGKRIFVQCSLTEEPDAECFAKASSASDDAACVVIRIRGTLQNGDEFDCIARNGGKSYVVKCNNLFDILVGRSGPESRALPGRSYLVSGDRVYT